MPPRITVITPSFNQAPFLEQTIRSVLDQDYPNLEYIVVDGGSTDGSQEIIERYAGRLHWWCSEPDRGQSHALNKGLSKATGDVIAYLNSDDWYLPGVLAEVGDFFRDHPETDFLYGRCRMVDEEGQTLRVHHGDIRTLAELLDLWGVWWRERQFVQPECFWSRRIFLKAGSFREDITNAFDYEYWTRLFLAGANVERTDEEICCFRLHSAQKSADAELTAREELDIVEPILWNSQVKLNRRSRLKLQANWLYQVRLLPAIAESVRRGDSRWLRWLKAAMTIAVHPKILTSPLLRERIRSVRQGRKSNT